MRVAHTYFAPENRAVAVYYRTESDTPDDPRLAGLDDQERQQVNQMLAVIDQLDSDQLAQMLGRFDEMASQAPPENQDMVAVLEALVREQLEAMAEGAGGR